MDAEFICRAPGRPRAGRQPPRRSRSVLMNTRRDGSSSPTADGRQLRRFATRGRHMAGRGHRGSRSSPAGANTSKHRSCCAGYSEEMAEWLPGSAAGADGRINEESGWRSAIGNREETTNGSDLAATGCDGDRLHVLLGRGRGPGAARCHSSAGGVRDIPLARLCESALDDSVRVRHRRLGELELETPGAAIENRNLASAKPQTACAPSSVVAVRTAGRRRPRWQWHPRSPLEVRTQTEGD